MKFLSFVDWPQSAFPSPQTPFLICVRGDFSFGTFLAEEARGASPHGRRVEVRWLREDQSPAPCHILFVSHSESRQYSTILHSVQGTGVLTIGETADFLDAGGAMSFTVQPESMQRDTLQLEVNLAAANNAHLTISSKLLAIARRVVLLPQAKKG